MVQGLLEGLFGVKLFGYSPDMFSNDDILDRLLGGQIMLTPYDPDALQPASIDVRLDRDFQVFDYHGIVAIDPEVETYPNPARSISLKRYEPLVLHPGEFVLGCTHERVTLGNAVAARLEGKSSLGRLGLLTHATAGFIDPGFDGQITLELSNVSQVPLKLWPGMKIGQLCFFGLDTPTSTPYGTTGSHYQGQRGPQVSRSEVGFDIKDIW